MKKWLVLLALLAPGCAWAQQTHLCYGTPPTCTIVSPTTPLPVTGNSNIPTYGAGSTNIANTGAGDVYCIGGSTTKIVRIKGIRVSATASTAAVVSASVVLRSSADSGGTSSALTVVKSDQNNPDATATVTAYSVSPTPGTAIGTIRVRKIAVGTQGNSATISESLFQFTPYWDQPIVLRGTSQFACVNVSAAGTGASWAIDHEHTEQDQ